MAKNTKYQKKIKKAVKKQYVLMMSQLDIVGEGDSKNYIAKIMVDSYRIANKALDNSYDLIKKTYIDNDAVPEPMKEVMNQYLAKEITKDEASKRLLKLKERTKQYLKELGVDPDKAETHFRIRQKESNLEDVLDAEITANNMSDDGSIDSNTLYIDKVNLSLIQKRIELAKRLGRTEPTTEELINTELEAYRDVYNKSPEKCTFKDKRQFEIWLIKAEQSIRQDKNYYKREFSRYKELTKNKELIKKLVP